MAKILSKEDKAYLLSIPQDDLTVPLITKLFSAHASRKDGKTTMHPARFDTKSIVHLNANEYINTTDIDTTVGSILFNKLFIEGIIESIIPGGFFNEVVDKKGYGKLSGLIATAVLEDRLPIDNLIRYLKHYEFYGMKLVTIFSPSYTRKMLEYKPELMKKKANLINKNDLSITKVMAEVEDELVSSAGKDLEGDPGMSLYNSGARGSFDNDYKNMLIALGPVARTGTSEFDFVESSYVEGLQKKDTIAAGNALVNAAFPKAVGTRESGYKTKQYYAVYQSVTCDEDGTDCGTSFTLSVMLTDDNKADYYYQNMMIGNKMIPLTPDNASTYVGRKIEFRSPMFCRSKQICSCCIGRKPYLLGIKNIGLLPGRISNTLLNASMKQFHNAKVRFNKVDINRILK